MDKEIKNFSDIKEVLTTMASYVNSMPDENQSSKVDEVAKGGGKTKDVMKKMLACMGSMAAKIDEHENRLNYHSNRLNNQGDSINNHSNAMYATKRELNDKIDAHASIENGHIPAIKSAEAMNKALASLGLSGDYEAKKKELTMASKDLFFVKNK